MIKLSSAGVVVAAVLLCAACGKNQEADEQIGADRSLTEEGIYRKAAGQVISAEASLKAADGEQIKGNIKFTDTGSGVRIVVSLTDASPGEHGIHVHEKGDCSDIPGKSMGGHFAPGGNEHALPEEASKRHLGDLGNIVVGGEGEGRLEITIADASLEPGDPMSFAGKALVIHQGRDSGKAKQPSGDSGTPIACGVIKESDD